MPDQSSLITRPEFSMAEAVPCIIADCSEPADSQARDYWTLRLAELPREAVELYKAKGGNLDLHGLCSWCAADRARMFWIFVRDEESRVSDDSEDEKRCAGYCSPYSNCTCQLMLDDGGWL